MICEIEKLLQLWLLLRALVSCSASRLVSPSLLSSLICISALIQFTVRLSLDCSLSLSFRPPCLAPGANSISASVRNRERLRKVRQRKRDALANLSRCETPRIRPTHSKQIFNPIFCSFFHFLYEISAVLLSLTFQQQQKRKKRRKMKNSLYKNGPNPLTRVKPEQREKKRDKANMTEKNQRARILSDSARLGNTHKYNIILLCYV